MKKKGGLKMAGFYENLNKQNYLKAMSGSYQNYGIDSSTLNQVGSSSQNVDYSISLNDEIKSAQATAEKATSGENHDDDPSWFQKIRNFIGNIGYGIEEGFLNFADGIGDFAMGIVGAIGGAVGNKSLEKTMKQAINTDWQAPVVNFTKSLNDTVDFVNALDPTSETRKQWSGEKNIWESEGSTEKARASLDDGLNNSLGSRGFNDVVYGISKGVGQMIPSLVTGQAVTGAVGGMVSSLPGTASAYASSVAKTANIATQATLGAIQGMGSGYASVAKDDGDLTTGSLYAGLKGILGAGKSAFSATIGGTLSTNARNFFGSKVAEGVLGKGGSETLANFLGNATSILTDSVMDGAFDAAGDLLDPALKQIYDSSALANAYGGDNWKQTLVSASKTFLTSALTSAVVDSAKMVANKAERADYVPEARDRLEQKQEQKEINRQTKKVEIQAKSGDENASETLEAVEHLNEKSQANKEMVKQAFDKLKKAQADVQQSYGTEDYTDSVARFKQAMGDYASAVAYSDEISDQIMQQFAEYNQIHQEAMKSEENAKANNSTADENQTAENENNSSTSANQKQDPEEYSETKSKAPSMKENDRDIDFLTRNGKRKWITAKDGKRMASEMYFTDIGGGVEAKIDQAGRIVYRSDDAQNIAVLMNMKNEDSKAGRIVQVDGELVGNKKTLSVDTSTADIAEINAFSKTLTDIGNYNTSYYNKETKQLFVENTNGLRFMFENGTFKGVVTEKPDWATAEAKQIFKTRGDYYTNNKRLIQQASTIGYVGKQKVTDFIDGFITNEDNTFKQVDKSSSWSDRTTTAYNLAKTDNERGQILSQAVDELYSKVYENGSAIASDKGALEADLKSWLDINQKHTEGQEITLEYKTKLTKLVDDINALKLSQENFNRQKNIYKTLKNKFQNQGKKETSTSKPYETMNAYIGQFSQMKFVDSIGGIEPESLGAILNGKSNTTIGDDGKFSLTGIKYSYSELEKYGLDYLYDPSTEALIDDLRSHYNDNGEYIGSSDGTEVLKGFTMEDSQAVTGLLMRLNKLSNLATFHNKTQRKVKYMSLVLGAESLQYGNPRRGKFGKMAQGALNSTLGINERMKIYFGEGSDAYSRLFTDVYNAHLDTNQKTSEIISDFQRMADTHEINTDTLGSKPISFEYNGEKVKMKMGEAMSIYLNAMSPDNLTKMMSDGYSTKDGKTSIKHNAIDSEYLSAIETSLPTNVKEFISDVFENGYNGKCKKILNDYSMKKYGYAQYTDENYVHRSIDAVEQTGTSSPDMLMKSFEQKHGDLGQSISIKRNGNRGALNIGDFFQEYASYAKLVAENVSMDAVKELNVAMNMRGSQDYKTDKEGKVVMSDVTDKDGQVIGQSPERAYAPDSVYSAFSRVDGGKEFIDNYMMLANGLSPTKSGKAMSMFNNAAATPIGFNPMTYLKMYLDPLRMIGKEVAVTNPTTGETEYKKISYGNFFDGLLNAFNARTRAKNGSDTFKTIQNSSRYYARSNQEQFAVSESVVGAKMSGWKNTLFYAPLEQANNAMMSHVVFPMLQSFAKTNGYGDIGTDTNTEQALNMFDALSVTALSNGDTLDASDLRSGRAGGGGTTGSILKVVFGIYGGDSQKKAEQISDIFLGNSRSKRRVNGYQAIIDKYEGDGENGSVIYEYEQREKEALEKYEKTKKLYEDNVDRDGNHTKKSEFDVMTAKANYEEMKSQTEAIRQTIDSMKQRIVFEKEHVQDPKNNAVKAGYVLSAFAIASAIEAGISRLGSIAKNKDDDDKLKTYFEDMGNNALVDWIPYVGTIANAVKYTSTGNPDFTPLQLQGLSKTLGSMKNIVTLIGNSDRNASDVSSTIYDAVVALGYNLGIPVKNIMDYSLGAITRVEDLKGNSSSQWANQLSMRLNGYSSTTLKSKATEYATAGNLTKATEYTQANMAFFKTGNVDWKLARELAKTGASVKDAPSLDDSTKSRFMNVYSKANTVAQRFISSSSYTKLKDEEKKSYLSKLYSAYYYVAEAIMNNSTENLSGTLSKALYAYYKGKTLTSEYRKILKQYKVM